MTFIFIQRPSSKANLNIYDFTVATFTIYEYNLDEQIATDLRGVGGIKLIQPSASSTSIH